MEARERGINNFKHHMELLLNNEELEYQKENKRNNDKTHQSKQKQGYFHLPPSPEFSGKVSLPDNMII